MKTPSFKTLPIGKSLLLVCGFLAFFAAHAYSMIQATVLVQGKVTDEKTGAPASVQYKITGTSGKTVKGKTLATDGSFKQVLPAGDTYTISFFEYNAFKSSSTFTLASSEKYYEDKRDFAVRIMHSGDVLLSTSFFDLNHPTVKPSANAELEKIITLMKDNRSLEVNIMVAADEIPKAAKKQTPVKPKKSGKKKGAEAPVIEAPVADPNVALVQGRISALRAQFDQADASLSKRLNFMTASAPNSAANVIVTIGEIKNKFE